MNNNEPINEVVLTAEAFQPILEKDTADDVVVRPSLTYWQDAWQRLRKNPPAMTAGVVLILMVLSCIVIPMFWPYSYSQQIRQHRHLKPSFESMEQYNNGSKRIPTAPHIFGTDILGRDIFVRTLIGGRISISIGLVAGLINLTIGVLYGGFSGYFGGKTDLIMMRIVEILDSIPLLLYVILLQTVLDDPITNALENNPLFEPIKSLGSQLILIYLVLGLVYWVSMARIVRGQVLAIKNQEYVTAARAQGASPMRVIMKHLVPNAMGQIIVMVMMSIPTAIFTEAFLSFVGVGVSAPMSSWGSLASDGYGALQSYPHLLFIPAAAICITILAFNILGDGLRDALDPRMKK